MDIVSQLQLKDLYMNVRNSRKQREELPMKMSLIPYSNLPIIAQNMHVTNIQDIYPPWTCLNRILSLIDREDINHDLIVQITDVRVIPNKYRNNLLGSNNGYNPMIWEITNRYLITGIFPSDSKILREYIQNHIKGLDRLFQIVPPLDKEITVFRGDKYLTNILRQDGYLSYNCSRISNRIIGKTIQYKQYVHTSLDISIVTDGGYADKGGPLFVIKVSKGSRILYHPSESQIILMRNSFLRIISIGYTYWPFSEGNTQIETIYCQYIPYSF